MALFKILAGDSWVPGLSQLNDDGSMNLGVVAYMCSYRLVVEWILLQVTPRPTPCWARSTKVRSVDWSVHLGAVTTRSVTVAVTVQSQAVSHCLGHGVGCESRLWSRRCL